MNVVMVMVGGGDNKNNNVYGNGDVNNVNKDV